jgi:hypothetical protein
MILLDFYNLLYFCIDTEINEEIIKKYLKLVSLYGQKNNITIEVIFDGIRYQHLESIHFKRLSLVFSLPDADSYIIKKLETFPRKTFTIITRDNKIKTIALRRIAKIIDIDVFFKELRLINNENNTIHSKKNNNLIKKTTDFEDQELDEIMKKS